MSFNAFKKLNQLAAATVISVAALSTIAIAPAQANISKIVAKVDISDQRMKVFVNGRHAHTFKVSTGAKGYTTPTGSWKPVRMHKMWYSRKYDNAPMPHSIFFHHGYAVHATNSIKRLGRPASHGCVRLHPTNAKKFFKLVLAAGRANTKIQITR